MIFTFLSQVPASCGGGFIGIPSWYKYLNGSPGGCSDPSLTELEDFWLIAIAIVEGLMVIAAYVSIIYFLMGAIRLITSDGDPGRVKSARNAMLYALAGLAVALVASRFVAFVGSSLA